MTRESPDSIPERVRAACARVAAEAELARIDEGAIADYAPGLAAAVDHDEPDPQTELREGDRETRAAFAICLNAINFGSGWWPTIRKRPGLSGYSTIAAGVTERFRDSGAWSPGELTEIDAAAIAAVLGQDAEHPLMAEFAASLRDVGRHVSADHGSSFEAVVDSADGSALAFATLLASWRAFADVSLYRERQVPYFKRAQLAAADLDRAAVASFPDRHRLTAFADNLVPHVLRVDGVLLLDRDLKDAIEAEQLLPHGSPGEVELRACAVHAVELLSAAVPGGLARRRSTPPSGTAAARPATRRSPARARATRRTEGAHRNPEGGELAAPDDLWGLWAPKSLHRGRPRSGGWRGASTTW